MTRHRRAVSLMELIVVVSAVSLLVSLLLPAVMAAREAARRVSCVNHLKQLGLAVHLHQDSQGHLPVNGWGFRWTGDPDRGFGIQQPGGWVYNVLPFVEEASLRDLGRGLSPEQKRAQARARLERTLPLFNCPSRRRPVLFPYGPRAFPLYNADHAVAVAKSDYAVNGGDQIRPGGPGPASASATAVRSYEWPSVREVTGVGFARLFLSPNDLADGASNTVLLGEKHLHLQERSSGSSYGDDQTMYLGDDADNRRWTFMSPAGDREAALDGFQRFGGPHPDVTVFVFCDGSTRVIASSVDVRLFQQLGNRHDGGPVDY